MPELPEIALYKKYVDSTALDKKITKLQFLHTGALQASEEDFRTALEGNKFQKTAQLGKYLFLKLKEDCWLVMHFGMTGKLEYYKNQEPPKSSRIIFSFENGYHLAFVCRRKLAKLFLAQGVEEFRRERGLGKHALDFNKDEFQALLQEKKGSIKGMLMDQHNIAGIGNVYADEMLYQCGIHPKTKVNKLSKEEGDQLFQQVGKILNIAIEEEGERSQFPDYFLTPHRKEGDDCPNGKGKVEMIKVSGRSTYFCPDWQQEK